MAIENNPNRPNLAQEAAKADLKKGSVRDARGVQFGQPVGVKTTKTKESASLFDNLLDSASGSGTTSGSEEKNPNSFDSKIKSASEREGRREESSETRKDDDRKTSSDSSSNKNTREVSSGLLKDRVLAKQGGEGRGEGGKQHSGQRGSSEDHGAAPTIEKSPKDNSVRRLEPGSLLAQVSIDPAIKPQSAFSKTLNAAQTHVPREIPKQILDQMVSRIVIGLNKNLQKEMRIDLSDHLFRGLSVKVTSLGGKVEVTFLTSNADVRRLFEGSRQEIGQALEEKNVKVASVQVQWIGA